MIDRREFWAPPDCCALRQKPSYFSRLREGDIQFDLSIEVTLPQSQDPSLICLIECKNYGHKVPVDDVEEFVSKLDQIGAHKGIIVSTGGFQKGAFAVAKNKRLGLMRFFGGGSHKWELRRSTATMLADISAEQKLLLYDAMSDESFDPLGLDAVFESARGPTISLWNLFDDLVTDEELARFASAQCFPDDRCRVPYLPHSRIGKIADDLRIKSHVKDGPVDLDVISKLASASSGFVVCVTEGKGHGVPESVLGRALFREGKLELFPDHARHRQQFRFTWAHELGHWCLGHEQYLLTDTFEGSDEVEVPAILRETDIARLEYQANRFASELLMPQRSFFRQVVLLLKDNDVHDKGHGLIYVDNQPDNLKTFHRICGALAELFDVSFGAAAVRLEQLGVLNDRRMNPRRSKHFMEIDWFDEVAPSHDEQFDRVRDEFDF